LREHGYELLTATNGREGLRLFMTKPVDAIVLDYHLGLLDGAVVAATIKNVKPKVPAVLLADHLELPDDALNSVDALVAKSDGPHFLLAAVHFVLNVKPVQRRERELRSARRLQSAESSKIGESHSRAEAADNAIDRKHAPFSTRVWRGIRNGSVNF
jgi:DNA-binding response OmpR family regulator